MSTKDKNVKNQEHLLGLDFSAKKVGIVVSRWNTEITSSLANACKATLNKAGFAENQIVELYVPGTFEIPAACKMLLQHKSLDAVIGIGCVIKGETSHNEYINHAVATGMTQLSIISGKPCIFGVLTPNDMQQAKDRAGGKYGNKGEDAAMAALEMMSLKDELSNPGGTIGFN